jgi:hypothetical protein
MVSLATKPNQPHPRGKEVMSIAYHPFPPRIKTDVQGKSPIKQKQTKVQTGDNKRKKQKQSTSQIFQQCPSNADVYRFRL